MDRQIKLGAVVAFFTVFISPLIGWGIAIENRLESVKFNTEKIEKLYIEIKEIKQQQQETSTKLEENHKELVDLLHSLELKLKDKANR